jgi:hypothetical protein
MNSAIDNFVAELAACPSTASTAPAVERAFAALDLEGDSNPDAVVLYQLMARVVADTGRTISERLVALSELVDMKGKVVVPRYLLNG